MNDTPGWASPGSAPSDRPAPSDDGRQQAPDGRQEPTGDSPEAPAGTPQQGAPAHPTGGPAVPADQPADPPAPDAVPPTAPTPQTSPGTDPLSKWSQQQPPPGQWSAPGGQGTGGPSAPPPPPPPAPGWGGQGPTGPGGYGTGPAWGGWQGRPPAAKPGVIPLRPLGVGEILDGAVSTMRTYWRTVLSISLTIAVPTQFVLVLLNRLVLDSLVDIDALNDRSATASELGDALRNALLGSGMVLVVLLLAVIIATALLTTVTSRAVLGRPVTVGEAWRQALPQMPRLLCLVLALSLAFVAIFFTSAVALGQLGGLGALVVTVWLWIRFTLAPPALMLEKQTVRKSLSRSAKLVKGSWWRIFGIQLLVVILAYILSLIILVPFTVLGSVIDGDGGSGLLSDTGNYGWTYLIISGIGSVISFTLTFPIVAGVTVLLYIDQRIRREALDLVLVRAAGVQPHGPEAPGAVPGS